MAHIIRQNKTVRPGAPKPTPEPETVQTAPVEQPPVRKPAPPSSHPRPQRDRRPQEVAKDKESEVREGDRGRRRRKKGNREGEIIVPTIEVMSFKELKKDIAERWRRRTKTGKKPVRKDAPIEPVGAPKKVKPSFILDMDYAVPTGRKHRTGKKRQEKKTAERVITIRGDVTLMEYADKIGISLLSLLSKIQEMGENIAANQLLPTEYCELLASEFGIRVNVIPEDDDTDISKYLLEDDPERMVPRPPVVTIMGHVDHGKTTLLDSIQKSDIVSREFGGITQHIGAYCIKTPKGELVVLDTPGHEAFTAMRARGAEVTDIVVLVVAADDGVMPQTAEAINHAKAAGVPIIVAINKIDMPGANPDRIKQELMRYSLLSEDLGGETLMAQVAARTGQNMQQLLDLIHLQSEVLDLKADPTCPAQGTVLESHMDPLRGVIVTVLVQKGTLHAGDIILSGTHFGKVRVMVDDHGQTVEEAGPSRPVEVIGMTGVPVVGESFICLPDEKIARRIASTRSIRRKSRIFLTGKSRHVTLESLHSYISDNTTQDLNIILKGDVQGSIEAITQSLEKLSTEKVKITIIHSGAGAITDGDVNLADASDAIIIGFNVRPEPSAAELAREQGVEIKLYQLIFELLDQVKLAMKGMLEPVYKEIQHGRAEVRQVFKVSKVGNVAGCFVTSGNIYSTDRARLIRDGVVVYTGKILSLRRVKDNVSSVSETQECGISLDKFRDVKEGDIIETYFLEEIPQEL